MSKSTIILIGIAGFLAVAIIAAGLWQVVSPAHISFAQEPTQTAQPSRGEPTKGGLNAYKDFFLNSFATRLGVSSDKVKEAYSGAFQDTLDQAVKDGKLTQDQADRMKNAFINPLDQGNLPGLFGPLGFQRPGGFKNFGFDRGGFLGGRGEFDIPSIAKALNMTETDLASELQSGKTIADVAKEKNIDLSQVKTSVLNDLKTKLDQAVQNNKLTQARADEIYNQLSTKIDTILNQAWPMGHGWRMH